MKANRLILNELQDDIKRKEITFLLGARQVGKTYLLKELETLSRASGKKTAFFSLEIPSDILKFKGSEDEIFRMLITSGEIIFLDEFHYLKNASHLLKAVYDSDAKVKIFASGSSSLEIHKHLKESLAGRRQVRKIFPLSVKEYKENRIALDRFLVEGGLPGLLNREESKDRQAYLGDLLETFILKDIKSLIKEENVKAFNHLLYLLAENQGSVVSVASLAKEIGMTARSIEKYLIILEQTYVCYSLTSYSTNQGNELKKSRKYYFYDLGIRNAIVKNFEYDLEKRKDKGILYESIVFLELLHKLTPNSSLHFWRTRQKAEVDFVKVVNRHPIPIEVKSGLQNKAIPDGMKVFLDRYLYVREAYVVNDKQTGELKYKNTLVKFIHWHNAGQIGS